MFRKRCQMKIEETQESKLVEENWGYGICCKMLDLGEHKVVLDQIRGDRKK
jgi:hypothetical protein